MRNFQVEIIDSEFDWCDDVTAILRRVGAHSVSRALGIPGSEGAINRRLRLHLRVFLVSEPMLAEQLRDNHSREYDLATELDKRTGGSEPEPVPDEPRQDNEPGPLFLQPRDASASAIVEAFGIYAPQADYFASSAGLTLPDPTYNGPAIFLCPERIFTLGHRVVDSFDANDARPTASLNLTHLFLRAIVLHELGHHLLRVNSFGVCTAEVVTVLSEAMANFFCDSLLKEAERGWLFALARQLQPSVYLGYLGPLLYKSPTWESFLRSAVGDCSITSNVFELDLSWDSYLRSQECRYGAMVPGNWQGARGSGGPDATKKVWLGLRNFFAAFGAGTPRRDSFPRIAASQEWNQLQAAMVP